MNRAVLIQVYQRQTGSVSGEEREKEQGRNFFLIRADRAMKGQRPTAMKGHEGSLAGLYSVIPAKAGIQRFVKTSG
jgi:hypothetical protein